MISGKILYKLENYLKIKKPTEGKPGIFKQCNNCDTIWRNRDDFLTDPNITIIGYQADFKELEAGIFLFNHICRTTLAIRADNFKNLYRGPVFQKRLTGTDECPSYCLYQYELGHCVAKCECAYVREIIQIIKRWPKAGLKADLD
jgi:hypothetical protein